MTPMDTTMDVDRYWLLDVARRLEVEQYLTDLGYPPALRAVWTVEADREGAITIWRALHHLSPAGAADARPGPSPFYVEAQHRDGCAHCCAVLDCDGGTPPDATCTHYGVLFVRELVRVTTPPPWLAWP